MKKHGIAIAATLMGIVFVALISVIIDFHNRMTSLRKEQFDASVSRSLFRASRALEMDETLRELKEDLHSIGSQEIEDSLKTDPMYNDQLMGDSMALKEKPMAHKGRGLISQNKGNSKGLTLDAKPFRGK